MARSIRQDTEAPAHDSFLDIVANMVGILIILVVVVGVRVKNAPIAAIVQEFTGEDPELEKNKMTAVSLYADVLRADHQRKILENEAASRAENRDMLATAISLMEHEIQSRRENLDAQSRHAFDLGRTLSESRLCLRQLQQQRQHVENAKDEPITVKNYPTPLSKTVDNREAHFQLRGGRIVYVPINELTGRFPTEFQRKKYRLRHQTEYTDTLGPIEGFRLKYTLERFTITPETAAGIGMVGQVIRLKRCEFIPISSELGETVDRALGSNSDFRARLSGFRQDRNTITVWTYPDSFDDFRRLKKDLYQLGFACAARPLEEGAFISGSPEGSKSAAQ